MGSSEERKVIDHNETLMNCPKTTIGKVLLDRHTHHVLITELLANFQ